MFSKINVKNASNQDVYFQSKYPEWTYYDHTGGLSDPPPISLPSSGWTELQFRVYISNQARYTGFVPKAFLSVDSGTTILHCCGKGTALSWSYSGPRVRVSITDELKLDIFSAYDGDQGRSDLDVTHIHVYLR